MALTGHLMSEYNFIEIGWSFGINYRNSGLNEFFGLSLESAIEIKGSGCGSTFLKRSVVFSKLTGGFRL